MTSFDGYAHAGRCAQVSDTIRDLTIRDPSPYVIILVNFYMCFVEQRSNDYIPLSVICVYFGLVSQFIAITYHNIAQFTMSVGTEDRDGPAQMTVRTSNDSASSSKENF